MRCGLVKNAHGEENGGDGGIRTLDRALQPYNGLANRRLQPLGHVSSDTEPLQKRGGRVNSAPESAGKSVNKGAEKSRQGVDFANEILDPAQACLIAQQGRMALSGNCQA
jgi:hypothetical protein